MNPVLKVGNFAGKAMPETIIAGTIAAMLAEQIPYNLPGLIGCVIVMISGSVSKLILSKQAKNPSINVGKSGKFGSVVFISALTVMFTMMLGCGHVMTKPEAILKAYEVAKPYMSGDCKAIGLYPGYELEFEGSLKDTDFINGFGGIVGGCDRYVKVACMVKDGEVHCRDVATLVPLTGLVNMNTEAYNTTPKDEKLNDEHPGI